jgi:hypothetical protein
MKCYECDKLYRGGKNWTFAKGFYTTYATCPTCYDKGHNPQQKGTYLDLRFNGSV